MPDTIPLPPRPELHGVAATASEVSYRAFKVANRRLMTPLHRAGLAAWLGNPLTGYQLLLTTIGRKSGLRRDTPLEYLVADGAAWVLAGYGTKTQWYRNLLEEPRVEVQLPGGRPFAATAEEVLDRGVRRKIIPALFRATGLPGFLAGANPWTAPDEVILDATAWVPLVRLATKNGPLVAGPDDPGGAAWIPRQLAVTIGSIWLLARVRGLVGRCRACCKRCCCRR